MGADHGLIDWIVQGNLSESSHGSWRRATRVFLGYTYHFRSFSSRLRHISAAARAFATSASGLVMEWSKIMSKMRDGLPPVCVTFWHSLAALHLSSAFRVAHRAPRASRSRSVRRPAKPHGRSYNAPSAGGGESTVYSSVLYRYSVLVLAGGSGAVFETEVCFD